MVAGDSNAGDNGSGFGKPSDRPHKPTFTLLDATFAGFCLCIYLVDLITDVIVTVEYFRSNHYGWGMLTVILIVIPIILIQSFSFRWFQLDESISCPLGIGHFCLQGTVIRYVLMLRTGFRARASDDPQDFQLLYRQQSDICMLRLFESFLESAPQLVLQLYIMSSQDDWQIWTGFSACASLVSLSWGIGAYTKAMRNTRPDKRRMPWIGLCLQLGWHLGMVASRIVAIVLAAIVLKLWMILIIGIHWSLMMTWIVCQHTDFCSAWWEEIVYNIVVAVVYCFSFFNIKEGSSRYRLLTYYLIIFMENTTFLLLYYLWFQRNFKIKEVNLLGKCGIFITVLGFIIGLICMLVYYQFFHPNVSLKQRTNKKMEEEFLTKSNFFKKINLDSKYQEFRNPDAYHDYSTSYYPTISQIQNEVTSPFWKFKRFATFAAHDKPVSPFIAEKVRPSYSDPDLSIMHSLKPKELSKPVVADSAIYLEDIKSSFKYLQNVSDSPFSFRRVKCRSLSNLYEILKSVEKLEMRCNSEPDMYFLRRLRRNSDCTTSNSPASGSVSMISLTSDENEDASLRTLHPSLLAESFLINNTPFLQWEEMNPKILSEVEASSQKAFSISVPNTLENNKRIVMKENASHVNSDMNASSDTNRTVLNINDPISIDFQNKTLFSIKKDIHPVMLKSASLSIAKSSDELTF